MLILKLGLSDFRSFKSKVLEFSEKTTVITGPNASGKTNILEAIFLLSTGKSFRARVEEEMVNHGKEIARIKGMISKEGEAATLEVVLTRGKITIGDVPEKTQKVARKRLLVNGVSRRLFDFTGNIRCVLFGPQDMDLVTESPSVRRKFLDTILTQVDKEYSRAIMSYEKGLRQRNKLLLRIREEGIPRSSLAFWDRLLIKNGNYISKKREEFIAFVNNTDSLNEESFSLDYDKSAISETRFEQYAKEEVAAATTLVGPHRDDFIIKLRAKSEKLKTERNLARYGSRGEQRMAVLWLKLAELSFIKSTTEEKPILLLDDIFSELDHIHRKVVMQVIQNQQTIITTADPHFIEGFSELEIITLKG